MIHHHKPECLAKTKNRMDYCIQGQDHSRDSKCQCLSRWYLLNHQTFCFQTWYCDASLWAGVSCNKIGSLFSRSKSQQGLIWSKYDNLDCIFWTADNFAAKLGLIVHCHEPECLMDKLGCVQGQGHSEGSKCQCLSRWYLLNHQIFCFQTWYCNASSWEIGLLCLRSRSQQNFTMSLTV